MKVQHLPWFPHRIDGIPSEWKKVCIQYRDSEILQWHQTNNFNGIKWYHSNSSIKLCDVSHCVHDKLCALQMAHYKYQLTLETCRILSGRTPFWNAAIATLNDILYDYLLPYQRTLSRWRYVSYVDTLTFVLTIECTIKNTGWFFYKCYSRLESFASN